MSNASQNFQAVDNLQLIIPLSTLLKFPLSKSYSHANLLIELYFLLLSSLKISPTANTSAFGAIMGNFKKTIMIDLDGVLNVYDGKYVENKLPELRQGAREFVKINRLTNQRFETAVS